MALGLPGAQGLFSLLQEAFRHKDLSAAWINLTPAVHDVFTNFRHLCATLADCPTRIAELVPTSPTVVGACYASGTGMGRVFFAADDAGRITPFLWRQPFAADVSARLVSFSNPAGTITNSDLKLCGNICHHDVIAQTLDVCKHTIGTLSDNVASVFWLHKGSTTTTKPPAFLLRLQAFHQRFHRYVPQHDYIPGESNVMADKASWSWNLTDSQLLDLFTATFPQDEPW